MVAQTFVLSEAEGFLSAIMTPLQFVILSLSKNLLFLPLFGAQTFLSARTRETISALNTSNTSDRTSSDWSDSRPRISANASVSSG